MKKDEKIKRLNKKLNEHKENIQIMRNKKSMT